MASTIIAAENLGKCFVIRHEVRGRPRYRRLSEELVEWSARPIRALLGRGDAGTGGRSERFWALRQVSFEISAGDVVGIIGPNGAGKSTLLKVLSRITEPTEGRVRIRGRVASLLEVGTGFHPELTGRENIFLNGTILGMTRREIQRKFDEIVSFAEIEKFLDTPVKRYSSGMYVRLAFSVAAHLEPEILIVDEVLAVGDIQFQKKCLGKMQDVATEGRTVMFVSHNMAAIRTLTRSCILLESGRNVCSGPSAEVIDEYVRRCDVAVASDRRDWGRGTNTTIRSASVVDEQGKPAAQYLADKPLRVEVVLETDGTRGMSVELFLQDAAGARIGLLSLSHFHGRELPTTAGVYRYEFSIRPLALASGGYRMDVTTCHVNVGWDHYVRSALEFEVPFSSAPGSSWDFKQSYGYGTIALECEVPPEAVRLGEVPADRSGGGESGDRRA